MKTVLAAMLISTFAMATSYIGVEPDLSFDKNYVVKTEKSSNTHINVKLEKNYFNLKAYNSKRRRQRAKYRKALALLERVMNSPKFKKLLLSYERKIGETEDGTAIKERSYAKNYLWKNSNKKLTNEQIYEVIMFGDEKMRQNTTGEMNLNSRVKKTYSRKVIGFTNPSKSKFMTLNWHFYKKFRVDQMVSNIVHEWIHLLGFLHGPRATMRQEVPYIVGGIAGLVAKDILENDKKTKLAQKM